MTPSMANLSFDHLRRIQATLLRRAQQRDAENIRAVGFAPGLSNRQMSGNGSTSPITAQFDVHHKLTRVPDTKRIEQLESVRLLDRSTRHYAQLTLATNVLQAGAIVPTGVRVSAAEEYATTSAVVRWTKVTPIPDLPTARDSDDPRWRWGVLSVAHLFASAVGPSAARSSIARRVTCNTGPHSIDGRVVARGRVPGGPDISLIETGLDRLWLSGFLIRPGEPTLPPANEKQIVNWVSQGTSGSFLGDGVVHAWTWRTFYPELAIERLGKLEQVIRYEATGSGLSSGPFGPGSSGGVLVAGGIPIGMQIAAMQPDYRVGFAQTFHVSLAWLRRQLRASALQLVSVLVDG